MEELRRLSHEALSGFDCSQHIATNIVIDLNNDEIDRNTPSSSEASLSVSSRIRTAKARAIITAFHYLDMTRLENQHPAENAKLDHRDHEAIMRGVWDLNLVATDASEWAIKGISVRRLAPLTGILYDRATVKTASENLDEHDTPYMAVHWAYSSINASFSRCHLSGEQGNSFFSLGLY